MSKMANDVKSRNITKLTFNIKQKSIIYIFIL